MRENQLLYSLNAVVVERENDELHGVENYFLWAYKWFIMRTRGNLRTEYIGSY